MNFRLASLVAIATAIAVAATGCSGQDGARAPSGADGQSELRWHAMVYLQDAVRAPGYVQREQ